MVLVDLVGYSDTAMMLEETLGVAALGAFNAGIQEILDQSLSISGVTRADSVVMTTGDGALLRFSNADQALTFAATLHIASEQDNLTKGCHGAKRVFRVGIGTGDVAFDTEATEGNGLAGMAIARAARLEGHAEPGGTLIDPETWESASAPIRAAFIGPETVSGKRQERFTAYRSLSKERIIGVPSDQDPKQTRKGRRALIESIIIEMRKVNRAMQVTLLTRKLQIPFDRQPSDSLTIDKRLSEILEWADRDGYLLDMFEDLKSLTYNDSK